MIIFNAGAIFVALISAVFLGPLFWLAPNFMAGRWGDVLALGIVTGVSAISDLVGIKGRVFFLPIWVWSTLGIGGSLYKQWGWWGPALALGVVVVMVLGLLVVAAAGEKKSWAEAPAKLNAARDSVAKGVSDETWPLLADAFFVPAFGDDTPERCRHNLEVLSVARKAMPPTIGALEQRVIDALSHAYGKGLASNDKVTISSEFTSALQAMLGNKGWIPEAEDRKALLEELDKPAAVAS